MKQGNLLLNIKSSINLIILKQDESICKIFMDLTKDIYHFVKNSIARKVSL